MDLYPIAFPLLLVVGEHGGRRDDVFPCSVVVLGGCATLSIVTLANEVARRGKPRGHGLQKKQNADQWLVFRASFVDVRLT